MSYQQRSQRLFKFLRKADLTKDLDALLRAVEDELDAIKSGTYSCSSLVKVNDAVAVDVADHVVATDNTTILKPVLGFVLSKPSTTKAVVQYEGEMKGFSGLTVGLTYYLGDTAGTISATPPSNPGQLVQRVGVARSSTTMVLMVDRDVMTI